jgi:L-amino acid N-acyltransferase YncA
MPIRVRKLGHADWAAVAAIYEEGLHTGNATFETAVPPWEVWSSSHLEGHRLVAELDGAVVGWTALAPVSARAVYAGVVEESIYVAAGAQGRGIGKTLLTSLLASADRAGIWTVQTGIFPENLASLALHRRCGFRIVGTRERLGRLNGVWRDVVLLERRSPAVT